VPNIFFRIVPIIYLLSARIGISSDIFLYYHVCHGIQENNRTRKQRIDCLHHRETPPNARNFIVNSDERQDISTIFMFFVTHGDRNISQQIPQRNSGEDYTSNSLEYYLLLDKKPQSV
jgi:hypothetical protein